MVHVDLIDGLAARDVAVDFIAKSTRADGIIDSNLVRRAKTQGCSQCSGSSCSIQ